MVAADLVQGDVADEEVVHKVEVDVVFCLSCLKCWAG